MPHTSYLTWLDKYVNFAFLFISVVIVNVSFLYYFDIDSSTADAIACVTLFVIWVLSHCYFLYLANKSIKIEKHKLWTYGEEAEIIGQQSHGMSLDRWKINKGQEWVKPFRQKLGFTKKDKVYVAHGED